MSGAPPSKNDGMAVIAGPAHPGFYPYWVMIVLMLVAILSYMDRGALNLLIDPVKADLHLDEVQVSLLIGPAFVVFYTTMGLVFGRWADLHGRRALILLGLVGWSLMTGLCGAADSFAVLLIARMGVGIGEATLGPAAYSLIADYFPPHRRGVAMSIYSSGLTLGGGTAFIIGGLIVEWAGTLASPTLPILGAIKPWQTPLLVMCLPGLAVGLLLFTVREPARTRSSIDGDQAPSIAAVAGFLRQNARPFLFLIPGYALMVVVAVASVLWVPAFYMRVHGMSPGQFGPIYGLIYCIAGTGGLFVGGVLSDWLASRGKVEAPAYVVAWAIIGSWPFYLASFLVSSTTLSLVLIAIATFVLLLHGGLQGATIQLIVPSRMRGQLGAAYLIVMNLVGMGLAPIFTAWMTEHVFGGPAGLGRSLALTVTLALPLGALLVALGLPHVRALARALNGPVELQSAPVLGRTIAMTAVRPAS